ncbi:MFS transporter [Microbispora catharanthi]|uniref:MFS transporter n=1 Tax=Microbispora catharanthi TaxID=1712871 RepID=A0A5N6BQZ7_9ACTN|nr:MFS transporter [Microbispora catharanthi]KAB8182865.1 MFS transporter [Microbispora catharanthi]
MSAPEVLRRLARNWIGLPDVPGARRWAWVAVIDAVGTGMRIPVTVLYLTAVVQLPAASVGVGLGVAALVGTVCAPAAGALIDRLGPRTMVIACFLTAATGYFGYLAIRDWVSFMVVAVVAEIAEHSARPAKQALVAAMVTPEQRVPLMAFQRSVRNIGFGLGGLTSAALVALKAHTGYTMVLAGDAVSFLVAAALVIGIHVTRPAAARAAGAGAGGGGGGKASPRGGFREVLADRRYVALAVLNTLVMTHVTALNVGVPLWIDQHTAASPGLVGVLFAMNTALVVLLQVRLTKGISRVGQTPPVYARAAAAFALAAIVYWAASLAGDALSLVVVLLVVGVLAHTAAELYGAVGEWTVSVNLAPEHLRGRYLSLFSISFSAHQAIGPVLVIVLITQAPGIAWFVLAAVLGVGCLASAWLAHGAEEPAETGTTTEPAAATAAPGTDSKEASSTA